MKANDIYKALAKSTKDFPISVANKASFLNLYVDSDFVAVTKFGQVYEFEVKISRSDYLRDFKKIRHEIYSGERKGLKPNRFHYVTLDGVVRDDLPDYAGLMIFDGERMEVVKEAPLIWKTRHDSTVLLRLAAAMKDRYERGRVYK